LSSQNSDAAIRKLQAILTFVPSSEQHKKRKFDDKLEKKLKTKSLNMIQYALETNTDGFKQYVQLLNLCRQK
jgi:hypothetical protein